MKLEISYKEENEKNTNIWSRNGTKKTVGQWKFQEDYDKILETEWWAQLPNKAILKEGYDDTDLCKERNYTN